MEELESDDDGGDSVAVDEEEAGELKLDEVDSVVLESTGGSVDVVVDAVVEVRDEVELLDVVVVVVVVSRSPFGRLSSLLCGRVAFDRIARFM